MKAKTTILFLLTLLVSVALACSLPFFQNSSELPDGLVENYALPSDASLNNIFTYSAEQQAIVDQYGNPTRFTILFGETARQETWMYDTAGYTVVFQNGVKVSEKTEAPEYRESMYATIHSPNLFYRGMGVDEIVLTTGKTKFMLTSIEGMDGAHLMDLEGLSIGLLNGQVSVVETIPALTETLLTPEDFVQAPARTPEELANEGKHFYIASYNIDGEIYQEDFGELEVTFLVDELLLTADSETILFNQTGQNQYYSDVDGGLRITFTTNGLTSYLESNNALMTLTMAEAPLTPQDTAAPEAARTPEELANEGKHSYIASYTVDGETYQDDFGEWEFTFLIEEVLLTADGETILFNQTGPNQYYSDADGGWGITFTASGLTVYLESDNAELVLTRQD